MRGSTLLVSCGLNFQRHAKRRMRCYAVQEVKRVLAHTKGAERVFLWLASAGCIEAGASRRTDGEPGWFERSPRYSTNSSSSRRVSRRYSGSSTMIALRLSERFVDSHDSSRATRIIHPENSQWATIGSFQTEGAGQAFHADEILGIPLQTIHL